MLELADNDVAIACPILSMPVELALVPVSSILWFAADKGLSFAVRQASVQLSDVLHILGEDLPHDAGLPTSWHLSV